MLSLLIAFIAAAAAWTGIYFGFSDKPWGWATVGALAAFIGVSLPINLIIRKKLEAIFKAVQNHILETQNRLRKKINMFQNKMQGGPKLQAMMEKEQAAGIYQAIAMLDATRPLECWNILIRKQVATLKGQLYFQIREYEKADPYLEKAFVLDPLTLAMKMVRMYRKDKDKELHKAFLKGVSRFKDEKGTLIYALYSWVLVKQNRIDEALAVLTEGKEKTESPVLQQNWEHISNGRLKRFSNAGLGDSWYALNLETPAPQKVHAQMPFGGGRPPRGGFR